MVLSGLAVFVSAGVITSFFSNDPDVIEYGKRYLRISAFVLPAYPIFFLSNGFFIAIKKSENAMINNFLRNLIMPIFIFYLAKYLSADFNNFFWLWVIFNWIFSLTLLTFILYYLRNKLEKIGAVLNP